MIWIDSATILIVGISSVLGAMRGLFSVVFSILSLILAFYASLYHTDFFLLFFNFFSNTDNWSHAFLQIITFFITYVGGLVMGALLKRFLRKMDFGGLDVVGGFLFGLGRAFLFVIPFILILAALPIDKNKETSPWQNAQSVTYTGNFIKILLKLFSIEQKYLSFDENSRPQWTFNASDVSDSNDQSPSPEGNGEKSSTNYFFDTAEGYKQMQEHRQEVYELLEY